MIIMRSLDLILLLCALAVVYSSSADDTCDASTMTMLSAMDIIKVTKGLIKEHDSGAWVQIGSNTMHEELMTNNPVMQVLDHIPHWSKVFVEPIPHNYDRLVENAKKWPNSTTVQAALSGNGGNFEGVSTMYCLEGYHLEDHLHHHNSKTKQKHSADELCSFDKKHVLKHFPRGNVIDVAVSCMSFRVLLTMYQIHDIRVLVVDTEGFDAAVIMALPLSEIRPPVIIYEHAHLTAQDHALAAEHLMKHCYHLFKELDNTYALHKDYLKLQTTAR